MQQLLDNITELASDGIGLRSPFGIPVDQLNEHHASGTRKEVNGEQFPESTPTPFHVDWPEIPPDGSLRNAELFLLRLEQHLKIKAFLSVGSHPERLKIIATTASGFEEKTKRGNLIKNALREASSSTEACRFAVSNGHTSLFLKQLREEEDRSLVLSFSLASNNPENKGPKCASMVIAIDRDSDEKSAADYAQTVEAIRKLMGPWLEIWWLADCGLRWQKSAGSLGRFLLGRKWSALLALALFLGSLGIPIPYWPKRDCVLEPAKKNFIASPIDGILKNIAVRPGDEVAAGALLAKLDDEPLRWELSTAQADMESAQKRRDAALTSRNSGDLRLAQLEQERQRVTIASLEKQLQDLELRSPIDGVIVQGNIDEHNGMPVTRGSTLFEIAPLDRMRLEVHLSTADLANIEVGQRVTLRVDADRWSQRTATITRIAPRAKVVDSNVVFVATAEIDNSNKTLRPGMDGKVRISAGTKSIGWLVFSKPYEWLISKLYW